MPVTVLSLLVEELNKGRIKVVDLTQPLGADTPVIDLPPMFAPSPPFSMETISAYDDKGPAWYWNTIHLGEHTGTHFDAPVHWITGKDFANNATDTIPVRQFVGPACVIDVSGEVAKYEDFLLTREHVLAWEGEHGKIQPGSWVLLRTDWSKRTGREAFLNVRADGPSRLGCERRSDAAPSRSACRSSCSETAVSALSRRAIWASACSLSLDRSDATQSAGTMMRNPRM